MGGRDRTRSLKSKGENKNKLEFFISNYLVTFLVSASEEKPSSILGTYKQGIYFRLVI